MSGVIESLRACGIKCYTREQWGSAELEAYAQRHVSHPMPPGPASYHFLHISVTNDTDTVREGKAGALQIEGYGYSTPPMVSYQDLVTNEGRYFEGQSYRVKGTHTINDLRVPGFPYDLNLFGYATALMQNVDDEVTDEQVRVVALIFAARELQGLVHKGAPVHPHRRFAAKSCPGDKAMTRLPEIVRLKNQFVKTGLPTLEEPDMAQYDSLLTGIDKKLDRLIDQQNKSKEREQRTNLLLRKIRAQVTDLATQVEIDALLSEEG